MTPPKYKIDNGTLQGRGAAQISSSSNGIFKNGYFGFVFERSFREEATKLKRESETKVKRAGGFIHSWIRIDAVIQTDGADRQLITQTQANRVTHVVKSRIFCTHQQIAGIEKHRAQEFAVKWERVFHIHDREEFTANRVIPQIMRTEIAFRETSHGRAAAVEEALVDGKTEFIICSAVGQGMDDPGACTKGERGRSNQRRAGEPVSSSPTPGVCTFFGANGR